MIERNGMRIMGWTNQNLSGDNGPTVGGGHGLLEAIWNQSDGDVVEKPLTGLAKTLATAA